MGDWHSPATTPAIRYVGSLNHSDELNTFIGTTFVSSEWDLFTFGGGYFSFSHFFGEMFVGCVLGLIVSGRITALADRRPTLFAQSATHSRNHSVPAQHWLKTRRLLA